MLGWVIRQSYGDIDEPSLRFNVVVPGASGSAFRSRRTGLLRRNRRRFLLRAPHVRRCC
jgi:hypothetical protein